MDEQLLRTLNEERQELLSNKILLEERLIKAPDGALNCHNKKGKKAQYYHIHKPNRSISYIRRDNIDLAKQLAQKEYDEKVLHSVLQRLKQVDKLIEIVTASPLEKIYDDLSQTRKGLVEPITISDEEYIREWRHRMGGEENTFPIDSDIYTEKGENVRSKSEKIIADKLYLMGIPYVYEPRLNVGGQSFFPDFAILNVRLRKGFYYEHFGMMDNDE